MFLTETCFFYVFNRNSDKDYLIGRLQKYNIFTNSFGGKKNLIGYSNDHIMKKQGG